MLARLRGELDTLDLDDPAWPDAAAKLPYLEAVVRESLRLWPILTEVMRTLVAPFELLGHRLDPGTCVGACVLLPHRGPEAFPEPERFQPERFLQRRFSAYEYLPFGGGRRRCLGAAFATNELAVVLAALLREWELELATERPLRAVRRNVAMAPEAGVPCERSDAAEPVAAGRLRTLGEVGAPASPPPPPLSSPAPARGRPPAASRPGCPGCAARSPARRGRTRG